MPKRSPSAVSESVAANIRTIRSMRNMTQAALAIRVELHSTVIAKIESGKRQVSIGEACAIAVVLSVTVDQLVNYPGAEHDRQFTSLVLVPLREFDAHLTELRHLALGRGNGSVLGAVERLAFGADSYRRANTEPNLTTVNDEIVQGALRAAEATVVHFPELRGRLEQALEQFSAETQLNEQAEGSSDREESRARAHVVKSRGNHTSN